MPVMSELARLEAAANRDPGNGQLRYLLGAQLAQDGHYERAVTELKHAIELQPDLHTARFQLGLLHVTLAQPVAASAVWAPLEKLEDGAALRLFKGGLEALLRDDFGNCIRLLESGIRANTSNAPLNRDMGLVVSKARAALATAPASKVGATNKSNNPQPQDQGEPEVRTDFSLYDQ